MKPYNVTSNEYVDYLKKLRGNVWKILPLYEESNKHIHEYVLDVTDRLKTLKFIVKELENGYWYIEVCTGLKDLEYLVTMQNEKEVIKRRLFHLTSLITNEITKQKGE